MAPLKKDVTSKNVVPHFTAVGHMERKQERKRERERERAIDEQTQAFAAEMLSKNEDADA